MEKMYYYVVVVNKPRGSEFSSYVYKTSSDLPLPKYYDCKDSGNFYIYTRVSKDIYDLMNF